MFASWMFAHVGYVPETASVKTGSRVLRMRMVARVAIRLWED